MSEKVLLPPDDDLRPDGAKTAGWWHTAADDPRVVCDLCPRHCVLSPGERGFCFVRENRDGRLVSNTYGRSTGFAIDPIEKKPLFHFYPGTSVLSFGTAGCNLGCKFCQNWTTSRCRDIHAASQPALPETIAGAARQAGCRSVAFTYNDPIVWAEYAIDTARACHAIGIHTVAVTSGYMNRAALAPFYEHIDAANVDLKAFSDDFYRTLTGGRLPPVLETLRWLAHESHVWLEITNLVIPQANDSPDEIRRMCRWIADELGAHVPLHFSAFHPDFELRDRGPTPPETLAMAYDLARNEGLQHVYTGNVVDDRRETTYCSNCKQALVVRHGYTLGEYRVKGGRCANCDTPLAGHFDDVPGTWGGRRLAVRIDPPAPLAGPHFEPAASWNTVAIATPDAPTMAPQSPPDVSGPSAGPLLTAEQEAQLFQAAGRCVLATVAGQPPTDVPRALGPLAAWPVYGAFVSLKRGKQLRSCCGSLGKNLCLGDAVEHAAQRAAKDDPRFPPIDAAELDALEMDVWLLWGLRPIAARGYERLRAITIGRHGVQIARGAASGLLLPGVAVEHGLDALAFAQQVCLKAGLPPDAWLQNDTRLMTFEGRAVHGRLADCGQRPAADPDVRPPAVAGSFYPAEPAAVAKALDELFADSADAPRAAWPAAMLPHAGWIYSGRVAAAVLARLEIPEQVVILAPKHRPGGAAWAVAPQRRWAFPGGELASDAELAALLVRKISGLRADPRPHRQEHAIEVQLPLLARVAPQARVVGITIGGGQLPALLHFAAELAAVLAELPRRPLLLISSDMHHFGNDVETRRLDRLALAAMETLDPVQLYDTVRRECITMCGVMPAVIVMETLRKLDLLHAFQLVCHTTSAETSGDTQRVVGYAGVLLGGALAK